ncbi:class I SAM-dependent RNA methyltransferase [Enteractinococcus fodinae]|uniref:tRNA/tmRNA/rRNA uracil-C5-methylase (TrmA/RlmC/RlmD family) n=1 Tax=Enteractinococcus fodinae TaxID=684663 RepID=A0ABU2B0Y2_9MICC|nr:TRAM domain-containing protein [Enteractinococcus fodinae]MDR7347263.1 tRNA/tmRNA/rRNA uracil-C5-methylase (TrmA/RlmC/RlmD family) [Enteractinococcus fodinae]
MTSTGSQTAAHLAAHDKDAGQILTLEVGAMAHGGHCVARHDGRVVFVRHAIPGEIVNAAVTAGGEDARFWRADTVSVVRPSEFRRSHQWKLADSIRAHASGRFPVGGAEFGHITLEHQRRLKAQVFRDTMARIGQLNVEAPVVGIAEDEPTGLHWRTRNAFSVTATGRLAMNVHRSATVVPVRNIPLGVRQLDALQLWDIDFTGAGRVEVATPSHGEEVLVVIFPLDSVAANKKQLEHHIAQWRKRMIHLPSKVSVVVGLRTKQFGPLEMIRLRGRTWLREVVETERYGTHTFRISGDGFWQVHRDAPATLVNAVMQELQLAPGQVIADLYAGAGLFSKFIADAVGDQGAVLSVEASPGASRDARKNLREHKHAYVINGLTDRIIGSWLQRPDAPIEQGGLDDRPVDAVVLDPPRAGAGRATITRIHQLAAEKIVYVSCDPASLARDTKWLVEHGWEIEQSTIYDLFPDTYHMETVTTFRPSTSLRQTREQD